MRWQALMLVCLTVGTTLAGGAGDANKKFVDRMQGEWKMQKALKGGKSLPQEKIANMMFIIKGDEISVRENDGKPNEHAKIVVDVSKKPATIDIIPQGKAERAVPGIVSLDGDTLRICFARPGGDRPKTFESAEGSTDALMELKRAKK